MSILNSLLTIKSEGFCLICVPKNGGSRLCDTETGGAARLLHFVQFTPRVSQSLEPPFLGKSQRMRQFFIDFGVA